MIVGLHRGSISWSLGCLLGCSVDYLSTGLHACSVGRALACLIGFLFAGLIAWLLDPVLACLIVGWPDRLIDCLIGGLVA